MSRSSDSRPICIICNKQINKTGVFLFVTPDESHWGACGKPKSCLQRYNDGEGGVRVKKKREE